MVAMRFISCKIDIRWSCWQFYYQFMCGHVRQDMPCEFADSRIRIRNCSPDTFRSEGLRKWGCRQAKFLGKSAGAHYESLAKLWESDLAEDRYRSCEKEAREIGLLQDRKRAPTPDFGSAKEMGWGWQATNHRLDTTICLQVLRTSSPPWRQGAYRISSALLWFWARVRHVMSRTWSQKTAYSRRFYRLLRITHPYTYS